VEKVFQNLVLKSTEGKGIDFTHVSKMLKQKRIWTLHRELAKFSSGYELFSLPVLTSTVAQWKKTLLMAVGYGFFFLQLAIERIRRHDGPASHFLHVRVRTLTLSIAASP
jgi:hypothetical protein